ncbi:gluconokinase [Puniceicoccaceae bacterium K14]|nr:gluconokinase [Puniceicoccaceae bacterium K14]
MVYVVMGVCGCGKSTIGKILAERIGNPFFDGDDFHTAENIEKMSRGHSLTDEDRKPWLQTIAKNIPIWNKKGGAVLACSALKGIYRDWLLENNDGGVNFIYLNGTRELLMKRLSQRKGHFMNPTLLDSQLKTQEIPEDAINVSIDMDPNSIAQSILDEIKVC